MSKLTRRDTLQLGAGALAGATLLRPRWTGAQNFAVKDIAPPQLSIEDGASLRVVRPSKFVAGDEQVFKENTNKFTEKTGVTVTIDWEAWEDLRPKTAVAANIGSGPDIVFSWLDDAQQFPDKLVDLTEIATYLGEKYGGWFEGPAGYGRTEDGRWISMPIGAGGGCIVYRKSWLNEAGFDAIPADLNGLLEVCKGMHAKGHPSGLALGNAVGDGNTWHWISGDRFGAGRREQRGHRRQPEHHQGARVRQGALCDLHSGHVVVARPQQQQGVSRGRRRAYAQRHLDLLRRQELRRPGRAGRSARTCTMRARRPARSASRPRRR